MNVVRKREVDGGRVEGKEKKKKERNSELPVLQGKLPSLCNLISGFSQ